MRSGGFSEAQSPQTNSPRDFRPIPTSIARHSSICMRTEVRPVGWTSVHATIDTRGFPRTLRKNVDRKIEDRKMTTEFYFSVLHFSVHDLFWFAGCMRMSLDHFFATGFFCQILFLHDRRSAPPFFFDDERNL